jgi:hypothetical protein
MSSERGKPGWTTFALPHSAPQWRTSVGFALCVTVHSGSDDSSPVFGDIAYSVASG